MNIKSILCPVDFSEDSQAELELARTMAGTFTARIILEHNLSPLPPGGLAVSWMWREEHVAERSRSETDAVARLRQLMDSLPPAVPREARLTRGPVDEAILELARRLPADLIVMASHGPSTGDHPSVTERVLQRSPCPVLTLGRQGNGGTLPAVGEKGGTSRALLALPAGRSGRALLRYGLNWCAALNLKPVLLHVYGRHRDPDEASLARERRRLEAALPERWRSRATCITAAGRPAISILEHARRERPALLLMGCHQRFGWPLLGGHATARQVLHQSPWPVWFLPSSARGAAANAA